MKTVEISALVLELLSAGVIAALITGIFSLIISIKNNKQLVELEKLKHKFTVEDKMKQRLIEAYNELQNDLPEDKRVGHFVMNMPAKAKFTSNVFSEACSVADDSIRICYTHFQKYKYLFSKEEQKKFSKKIEELDEISKSIIEIASSINVDDLENLDDETSHALHSAHENRITKIYEIEEMYFNLYSDYLSRS